MTQLTLTPCVTGCGVKYELLKALITKSTLGWANSKSFSFEIPKSRSKKQAMIFPDIPMVLILFF